jgi:hypothetical protein
MIQEHLTGTFIISWYISLEQAEIFKNDSYESLQQVLNVIGNDDHSHFGKPSAEHWRKAHWEGWGPGTRHTY